MDEWKGRMVIVLKYTVKTTLIRDEAEHKRPKKEGTCKPCHGKQKVEEF